MGSARPSRGPRPDRATVEAFLALADARPRPLPLVGHVRHDGRTPGAIYVGRRCYGLPDSRWGNPFVLGKDGNRAYVLARYEDYAREMLAADPRWLDPLRSPEVRVLTCWCRRVSADRPACHGDTLLRLLARGGGWS